MDNSNMTIEGLKDQQQEIEKLLSSSPGMEKYIRNIIRKVMTQARKQMQQGIHGDLGNDPRQAYKAVKTLVYKRIFGGNISILNRRKASGGKSTYQPVRRLRAGQRGGNRVRRGERTQQVMDYQGADRAFVLRFLNAGTIRRTAGTRGGILSGNRGSIGAYNLFARHSRSVMQYIDQEITREFNELLNGKQIY